MFDKAIHRNQPEITHKGRLPAFITVLFKLPLSHVSEVPFNRRRRGHHWTNEMRPAATALTPFEVPITRRRATLTRLQNVGVHSQTHRTSSFAPFESGFTKNSIEPFRLRFALNLL
jgi:hypothetical protein